MDIGNPPFRAPFGARQVHTEDNRRIYTPYMRLVPYLPYYKHIRNHDAVSSTQQVHQQQHHNIPHEQDRHKHNTTSPIYLLYMAV
jgi:hypothetical protein